MEAESRISHRASEAIVSRTTRSPLISVLGSFSQQQWRVLDLTCIFTNDRETQLNRSRGSTPRPFVHFQVQVIDEETISLNFFWLLCGEGCLFKSKHLLLYHGVYPH